MTVTPLAPRVRRTAPQRPLLSVVVPLYDESGNVDRLVEELGAVLRPLGEPFEIVLVDDGSSDDTWARIAAARRREPAVKGVSLMRNFGHQCALVAGLAHASGRAVVTMDGDLQHPPELLPELLAAWRRGARVVHTSRLDSEDTGWAKRWTARAYSRVFSRLAGFALPPGTSDFRLLDGEVVATLLDMRDPAPFLRGMVHWLGAASATVVYRARPRRHGRPKFDLRRMLRLSASGLIAFCGLPIRLGLWAGLATGALAAAQALYLLATLASGHAVPAGAVALAGASGLFAVLFLLLGSLGAYLVSLHAMVANRPAYVVGRRLGIETEADREWACSG